MSIIKEKNSCWLFVFLFFFLVAGCGKKDIVKPDDSPVDSLAAALPFQLPATFSGKIECPDCEYIQIYLNLRPDQLYQLRKTYFKDGQQVKKESQMRRWFYDENEGAIILGKRKGALKTYVVESESTLRFSNIEGETTGEQISYKLDKQEKYDHFTDEVKIRGMYSSTGNNHTLEECSSGQSFIVDPSAQFSKLERFYKNTPHEKNESLLVSITGKLLPTRTGGQLRDNDVIVVTDFNRIYPNKDCSGQPTKKTLFDVHWTAVEIAGIEIVKEDFAKEPFFVLETKGNKVHGFSGCNRFFGTYFFKGDIFLFNKVASTRMACPKSMTMEDAFLDAVQATESFRIEKNTLILLNQDDDVVMKLKESK